MRAISPLTTVLVAFLLSVGLTALVRAVARRLGVVAVPKRDRWHRRPTAMMGGLAIAATMLVTLVWIRPGIRSWMSVAVGAATALLGLGLVDDFWRIKPYQKLVGQFLAACLVTGLGLILQWTGKFAVDLLVTLFWLVGVTNAVNMLDNMDGLAAGTAAIGSLALCVNAFLNGQVLEASVLAAFFGALVGFLVFNHHPASIFMGDCGSMFVGFFLACAALSSSQGGGRSRSVVAVLAVPVLVLSIPIFDTTFVTLTRKLVGRAASQGGRDHTSHRLVALGMSERRAVWMLWCFAAVGGSIALLSRSVALDVSLAAIAGFVVLLTILGVYLADVHIYTDDEMEAARRKPIVSFLITLAHKRRVFEVALDVALIVLAYYLSHLAKYGPVGGDSPAWTLFVAALPVVVCCQLAALLAAGVYRGTWRYASLSDALTYVRATIGGAVLTFLVLTFGFGIVGVLGTVLAIDGLLLLLLVAGSRFTFRALRRLLPLPHASTARRVLIYGAGAGGELVCRELFNNPAHGRLPVAFADDDVRKDRTLVHALRVHAGDAQLTDLFRRLRIEEVILSTERIPMQRLLEIVEACERAGVALSRLRIEIAGVSLGDSAPSAFRAQAPDLPAAV